MTVDAVNRFTSRTLADVGGGQGRPKISLVMATVGRTSEPRRFLEHLSRQTWPNFELVIVDQNRDERLCSLIEEYGSRFPLSHLKSAPGLSRARNAGLRHISGDVVGFPDDDCWYPPTLLAEVARRVCDGTGRGGIAVLMDYGCSRALLRRRWPRRVTRLNVWALCLSCNLFFSRDVVSRVGDFDESLGLGAGTRWGSGEDTDFALRAISAGCALYFDPRICVKHPPLGRSAHEHDVRKARSYANGMGRVLRQHGYPYWYFVYRLGRPLAGVASAAVMGEWRRSTFHWNNLIGRLEGWVSWTR